MQRKPCATGKIALLENERNICRHCEEYSIETLQKFARTLEISHGDEMTKEELCVAIAVILSESTAQRRPFPSLQERALETQAHSSVNLGEFLQKCSSSAQMSYICSSSPEGIKAAISYFLGPLIVAQRDDLNTGKEWYDFAVALAQGNNYKFGIVFDGANEVIVDPVAKPFYAIQNMNAFQGDTRVENFDVPGTIPPHGTEAFLVHMIEEGRRNNYRVPEQSSFFTSEEAAKRHIAFRYFNGWTEHNFFDSFTLREPIQYEGPIPSLDYFTDLVFDAPEISDGYTSGRLIGTFVGDKEDYGKQETQFYYRVFRIRF